MPKRGPNRVSPNVQVSTERQAGLGPTGFRVDRGEKGRPTCARKRSAAGRPVDRLRVDRVDRWFRPFGSVLPGNGHLLEAGQLGESSIHFQGVVSLHYERSEGGHFTTLPYVKGVILLHKLNNGFNPYISR